MKINIKELKLILLFMISMFVSEYSLGGCSGTNAPFVPVNPTLPEMNCPSYSSSISSSSEACGNQFYHLIVPNTGCNSQIYFTVSGNNNKSCEWYVESLQSGDLFAVNGTGLIGPLDPNVHGTVFDLVVDNSDNPNGVITVYQDGIPLASSGGGHQMFNVNPSISSATITVQTPSGNYTKIVDNCNNFNIQVPLANNNFCTPVNFNLPWEVKCDETGAVLSNGVESIVIHPRAPENLSDLVDITWNSTTCSWDVSPNNDCDQIDIGSVFSISPDPTSVDYGCSSGTENFTINYLGTPGNPNCCATAGPLTPISYEDAVNPENVTPSTSMFWSGSNHAGYINFPPNSIGGNATSVDLCVNVSNFCFQNSDKQYYVMVYIDGITVYDQMFNGTNMNVCLNLSNMPYFDQYSNVEIYVFPNVFGNANGNTNFNPNATCGNWTYYNEWTANISASIDVTYEEMIGSPLDCHFSLQRNYSSCGTLVPTFTNPGPICAGESFTLPTTSDNGISGTWSPAINTSATTTYTFTPNAGQCATTQTMQVVVTPGTTPTFTNPGPICAGESFTLPTTSDNGISGTWSPAINTSATTTYTFTPNAGQCAATQTMQVVVTPEIVPTFTQIADFCESATLPTLPPTSTNGISGTWSPSTVSNTAGTTTYTFTPDASECATTASMSITVTPEVVPTFTQIADFCEGTTAPTLPTTSDNGISGTWSPSTVSNTAGTTTYTFTPDASECATTASMNITVTPEVVPTFTQIADFCEGTTAPTLPTTSNNGISGTWSPATVSNAAGTTTYTFTPDASECATTASMNITVTPEVVPTFTQIADFCEGTTAPTLPPTSTNGISGTWSPSTVSNTAGTTTYTFTPDAGQCAVPQTMDITVAPEIVPTFTQIADFCESATLPTLPPTSNNGISGTWSPATVSNTVGTTTYTFTPDANECATTASMNITVTPEVVPTFTQIADFCEGTTAPTLPTTSNNGISGTWSPSTVSNTVGTTTYTFTPDASECATLQTMDITVGTEIVPTFTQIADFCESGALPTLLTTSNNGISGTWSPSTVSNTVGTTTYTFTPDAGQCAVPQTMDITVAPEIVPTFTQIADFCESATLPTLLTTSNNGISGTWSPSTVSNAVGTTTYTFTPDASECATTASMNITVTPEVVPTFTQIANFCEGTTAPTLSTTSNNGISGTWSPSTVSNTAGTTTYTFTPDASECATTASMSITVTPGVTPTFTNPGPLCSGEAFTLPATSNNGISGTWSPAINTSATTTYTFTPNAGQCGTVQTMEIVINPSPLFTIFSIDPTVCGINNGTIVLEGLAPNTDYVVSYEVGGNTVGPITMTTDGFGNIPISNLGSGNYSNFTVVLNGCSSVSGTNINLTAPSAPTVDAGQNLQVCEGESITLTALNPDGASISWNNGVVDGQSFIPSVGTTNYVVTAELSGCMSTDNVTVTVYPMPVVEAGNDISICEGQEITLTGTGTGATSYTWNNGVVNGVSFIPPLGTTVYTVTGTAGHCSSQDEVTVTVASSLDASFVVNSDEVQGCAPLTVSFMKTSAGSGDCFYTLSDGTVLNGCNPTYTFTQPGCYDVTLTVDDGQGCSGTFTEINMICVDAPPKASFEMNPMQLNTLFDEVQFTNTSVGANTYQWFFGDGGLSSEIHPAHVYDLEEKQYTITLVAVSELGCRDTTSLTIGVEEELIYYVPNSFTPDGDVHNPTFKPVFTDGFDPMDYHLTIFNRWGETVFESHDAEIGWDGRYGIDEVNKVKEGVYIYKIRFKKKYSAEYIELVGHVSLLR